MPKIFSKFLGFLKNDQAANAKNEPINNVQPLQTVSTPIEQAPAQTKKEIVPIVWSDLSPDKVINRYLTTDHSTSPAQYDFYEYHKAEFDCILHNLEKVEDEGVLKDMLNLINAVYKHYISGNWER